MLHAFGFDRVAVLVSDLHFLDPEPAPGQEGAERGVRLEVRDLEQETPEGGSIYAAPLIRLARPRWRLDLLESVGGAAGSFDRAHHHPRMAGWEPGEREFDPALSADPLGWTEQRLRALPGVPAEAVPEIMDTVRRLLDRVRA